MTKQIAKLTKGVAFFAMTMMWGISGAGEMMNDHKMSDDKKMMEMEKTDTMKIEGQMKTEMGDMKAMETEMETEKMEGVEMNKEESGKM